MDGLSLAVAGIDFSSPDRKGSNRRFEPALCGLGEPVELRHEPRIRHDIHTSAVLGGRGTQLGYLSAERVPWIGRQLAAEEAEAVFQQLHAPMVR